MATSTELHLAPLVEAYLAWTPCGIVVHQPPAMEMLEEEFAQDALPGVGPSWPGCAARRVAGGRRAGGEVSPCVIPKERAQGGDDGESLCSTVGASSPRPSSSEEGYEHELAKFDLPHEPASPIAGFLMDTPVPAGSAAAPPVAEATGAEAAAQPAPSKQAPQIVTTLMVQNLNRSITRRGLMLSLDEQGFEGRYNFVHLPTAFGTRRNKGFAFVNFKELEDAEKFANSIVRIKGSKVRVVPADVQGLDANALQASSHKVARIRSSASRPWVASGDGQDALLHA